MKKLLFAIAIATLGSTASANPWEHKTVGHYIAECVFSFSAAYGSCYYAGLQTPDNIGYIMRGLRSGELEYRGWGPTPEYFQAMTPWEFTQAVDKQITSMTHGGVPTIF